MSVALVVQHAKRMCHIMLSFVPSLTLPYFSTSHKWHDSLEKITELKMCVFIFSTTFIQNVSLYKNNSIRYHKFMCLHVKYLLFVSDFNET